MNFDQLSRAERLIAEQAVLNLRTLNAACNDAVEHIAETSRAVFGAETNEESIWKQRGW